MRNLLYSEISIEFWSPSFKAFLSSQSWDSSEIIARDVKKPQKQKTVADSQGGGGEDGRM